MYTIIKNAIHSTPMLSFNRLMFPVLAFLLSTANLAAQTMDTVLLPYELYIQLVSENHPVMRQVQLLEEQNDAVEQMARGGFDPKIAFATDHKQFDQKDYYNKYRGKLELPTRFGAIFDLGYENNSGIFLNSENNVPIQGLLSAGVFLPLGSGLLYDERRKALDDAELIRELNDQEQIILVSELWADATLAYLKWQLLIEQYRVQAEIYELARTRLDDAIEAAKQGNIAAIDTVELSINTNTRQQQLVAMRQEIRNARFKINNYLWGPDMEALQLDSLVQPDSFSLDDWNQKLQDIEVDLNDIRNIPELNQLQTKGKQLELERRLQREFAKPVLDLQFNPLYNLDDNNRLDDWYVEDNKFSASFSYPILNRKQRGKIRLVEQKIVSNELKYFMMERKIENRSAQLTTEILTKEREIEIINQIVQSSFDLLQAEEYKYFIGESSAFLINSRESKYASERIKLNKKTFDFLKSKIELRRLIRANELNN